MNDRDLIMKAAFVARSAPEGWKHFLGALSQYNEKQRDNCVSSPIEQLPVAQGRAQATAHLLGLLADCQSMADKIERKTK